MIMFGANTAFGSPMEHIYIQTELETRWIYPGIYHASRQREEKRSFAVRTKQNISEKILKLLSVHISV